jgi:hypothetical protein
MSPLRGVAKGNQFAQKVADYLGTERRVLNGSKDKGDLVHRSWCCEVKATGRGQPLNLSAAMTEAKIEATHAGTPGRYCVITRRTGYPVAEAFFVMPLWMAVQVVPDLASGQLELTPAAVVDVPTGDVL